MRYAVSRLAYFVSLWFGVAAATFALFHVVPTDPARTMLGATANEAQVATLRRDLGLDRPVTTQFLDYLSGIPSIEFGRSFVDRRPVGPEVAKRLRLTVALAALATSMIILYLVLSLTLAVRSNWVGELTDFACVSLPTLFSGMIVALATVAFYPFTRFSGALGSIEDWLYLLPPALVLALYPMGVLGRIARTRMKEALSSDYVRTARSLGLSESTILFQHILRNAAVPLLASFGVQLPLMITNTFIVEIVFSVPGIGALLLRSVLERDLPMLEGIAVVSSLVVLSINLAVELIYPIADPRIGRNRDS